MSQSNSRQYIGRAMNTLQEYFIKKLLFPKIYLDVVWNNVPAQMLAIDRVGVGDVHLVWMAYLEPNIDFQIATNATDSWLPRGIEEIKTLPSHYRYVAIVSSDPKFRAFIPNDENLQSWLADDGVGRVGILHIDLSQADTTVRVILKAERFRSSQELTQLADEFVASHQPNWEVRE